ncbi:hypothetical protein EGW08_012575 [Elysia chlorotica]|uniref:RING-type domain-containing protein n=1 Tax=Elysia chlorotica TaxID=188477 RepID=A0A433TDI3_ELYCH|nr:hypothetical protein EGW08_012575 [Elysia chlorotica]
MEHHSISFRVSLPLLGVGAFTLLLSFCFCFYLWSSTKTKILILMFPQTCSVCLEDFSKGDKIAICTCRHVFHSKCLTQWLQCRNNCPLCKAPVTKSARETTGLMRGAASGSSV